MSDGIGGLGLKERERESPSFPSTSSSPLFATGDTIFVLYRTLVGSRTDSPPELIYSTSEFVGRAEDGRTVSNAIDLRKKSVNGPAESANGDDFHLMSRES